MEEDAVQASACVSEEPTPGSRGTPPEVDAPGCDGALSADSPRPGSRSRSRGSSFREDPAEGRRGGCMKETPRRPDTLPLAHSGSLSSRLGGGEEA